MFHGINGHGWGMGWWWLVSIVILTGIIWSITQGFIRNKDNPKQPNKSALDILKERYALGEINKQEFEERKKELT